MSDTAHHPDVKALVDKAMTLEDGALLALAEALQVELDRRYVIKDGLDVGERLQFDTTIDLIRERTKLSVEDALAMIRAHVPGRARSMP